MNLLKNAYQHYLLLLLLIFSSYTVFPQTHSPIAPKLNTTGLANEKFIQSIFTGDFAAVNFDRDEPGFSLILDAYIDAYWNKCGNSLPADKVEITYQECARWIERTTTGYYGTVVTKDCLEWQTHHTNVYTTPALYEAKTTVDALQTSDEFRSMFRILKQNNPIGITESYVEDAVILKKDMSSFFSLNDCSSAGMKRFEQNLYAFAMNKLPIVLEGSQMPHPNPDVLLKDQVFNKLIDDLIKEQSKTWVMNQYVPNSVTRENVVSKDNEGRPASVTANYRFMLGRQDMEGSVTVTFLEGLPNCLYFSDNPVICRTANRKIVLNYAMGKYINADTLYKTAATFYTVDKTDSNWIIKFKMGVAVELNHPNLNTERLFTSPGQELVVKPGDWAIITGRAEDFVHGAEYNVDHRPKPVPGADGKIPDYSIDKTSYPGYWVVRFYKPWYINVKPGLRSYGGGGNSDFYVPLEPNQCIERQVSDDSSMVLKDLDRRDPNAPPYTVNKTRSDGIWIVQFNTSMNIRIAPEMKTFYLKEAGSGKQIKPGEYVEKKNDDGSITLLKDLDHR